MDKIKFQAQERLDLVDAADLQTMVYSYISEALGGLMGNAGGALTTIEYTTAVNGGVYTLELGAFQYYHAQPDALTTITEADGTTRSVPKHFKGQVVSFNPVDEGQTATVDWTIYQQAWENTAFAADHPSSTSEPQKAVHGGHSLGGNVTMPILWARPVETETDTDARREWSVAAQAEVAMSIKTRTRIVSAFKLDTVKPVVAAADTNQNIWVPIARTVAWDFTTGATNANGAVVPDAPYLAPLYVWDHTASYGGFEAQNALESATLGGLGQGIARFMRDDGATGASSSPATDISSADILETAPFEHDGATISNLARGGWTPGSKTGEPGLPDTGATAAGAGAWPYPGWYDNKGASWKSFESMGIHTDVPIWRLGLPQVMTMMRRMMAAIMSSDGNKPWYAWPTGGGLAELSAEIAALRTELTNAINGLPYVKNLTTGDVALVAQGRLFVQSPASSWMGGHLNIIEEIETSSADTALISSLEGSGGARGIVCQCTEAGTGTGLYAIQSIQVSSEAYGTMRFEQDANDTYYPTGLYANGNEQGLVTQLAHAWLTPGDKTGGNKDTHFTLWVANAVLGPGATVSGFMANNADASFQITVWGKGTSIATI